MTRRAALPAYMTPRLLGREVAAAYCGISPNLFVETVAKEVPPIEIRGRRVWDVRALDRWVDAKSGLVEPLRPIEDWLGGLGDDRARQRG